MDGIGYYNYGDQKLAETVVQVPDNKLCHQFVKVNGLGIDIEAAKKNLVDNVWNIIHALQQFAEENS